MFFFLIYKKRAWLKFWGHFLKGGSSLFKACFRHTFSMLLEHFEMVSAFKTPFGWIVGRFFLLHIFITHSEAFGPLPEAIVLFFFALVKYDNDFYQIFTIRLLLVFIHWSIWIQLWELNRRSRITKALKFKQQQH